MGAFFMKTKIWSCKAKVSDVFAETPGNRGIFFYDKGKETASTRREYTGESQG